MVALAVVVAGGVLLLEGSHRAPSQLALSGHQSGSVSPLAGTWTVAAGSQVGYRAKEKFINQPAETEAVARTSSVKGSLVVAIDGSAVKVSRMKFTADLASLVSQDKYANYDVYQRDFFVRRIYLETDSFPTATYAVDALSFPTPASGPVDVDVTGKLTVHGVTKVETAHLQATGSGNDAEIAGSMNVDMRDFGIDPPDISFTRAEPEVTIEFDLKLVRS